MENRRLSTNLLNNFELQLRNDEKSESTIQKYKRDINFFLAFAGNREIDKNVTLEYKESLLSKYTVTSANSMIAALNAFLKFLGWIDCVIKQYKVQRQAYCSEDKELTKAEYIRLVNTAKNNGNEKLSLILQTICGTGIRVSELKFITVEAVNKGEAIVSCKGKTRTVFIVKDLKAKLLSFIRRHSIKSGAIFITRSGKPINRCNVWKAMKALCEKAGVSHKKVFPHNLRHLFARVFYGIDKDIAKLADILGHASINTTRIYIITTCAEHKRKMETMKLII